MLKHIEVSGTHYECGFQIGKALKDCIAARLDRHISKEILEHCRKNLETVHATCKKKYPRFIEELEGMATGSEVDFWKILLANAPELRGGEGGCTDIAKVVPGHVTLTHNEDAASKSGDDSEDCALITYHIDDFSFSAFTYAGELSGDAYSWNSYGFFFTVSFLNPLNSEGSPERVPRDFTARALIEAKNIENALEILQGSPDASGYHYYMGFGGRIFSAEQYLDKVSLKEVIGSDVHTNHYLHPEFAHSAPAVESSTSRQERAQELLSQRSEPLAILTDRVRAPHCICRLPGDDGLTLSTVSFDAQKNSVTIYTPSTLEKEYSFPLKETS